MFCIHLIVFQNGKISLVFRRIRVYCIHIITLQLMIFHFWSVSWALSRSFFLLSFTKGVFSPIPPARGYFCLPSFIWYHVVSPHFVLLTCFISAYLKLAKYCHSIISIFKHFSITYRSFRSKVLVRKNQCLLAQTHRILTGSPINFSIRFSSSLHTRLTWH